MTGFYSRAAMRQAREEREARELAGPPAQLALADIPVDSPADDALLTVWDGQRWVAYDTWLARAPIVRDEYAPAQATSKHDDAKCVVGDCNGKRVWLVRDSDRWLMFAGSRGPGGRRRDFASPFLEHAIRTAELWYGAAATGWCPDLSAEVARG
ncbi:MAG: hypothetical protein IT165_25455 [Bryobacterales bacterium]|nr:hypothetical protein [Bryobacterales bacterium]